MLAESDNNDLDNVRTQIAWNLRTKRKRGSNLGAPTSQGVSRGLSQPGGAGDSLPNAHGQNPNPKTGFNSALMQPTP